MRIFQLTSTTCLALFLCLPALVPGDARDVTLGHDGRLQRALTGTYGELFDGGESLDAAAPVLAVEIARPGEESARSLVPGTEDSRIEAEPLLFQDWTHDSFVALWQSIGEDSDTHLRFSTFGGTEWSAVYTLERDGVPISLGDRLSIAESHDTFELELDDGESISTERRVLHVIWHGAGDSPLTHYAPLNFIGGHYLGWHAVVDLDETFLQAPATDDGEADDESSDDGNQEEGSGEAAEETTALSAELARTLGLRTASDDRSVLVTFANPSTHRIGTLEISPLPLALGILGEQVRERILELAEIYDPNDISSFSDEMRAGIIIMGSIFKMHEAYGAYVADQVADWLSGAGEQYGWDLESMGNDARDLTIDVSADVYASTKADPADPGSDIIEINIAELIGEREPDPAQDLDILMRSNLPAPSIGDGPTSVYTSRNGRSLLVAWEEAEGGTIHWLESRREHGDETWSDPFSLTIDEHLTREQAHALLAAKVH